MRSRTAVDRFSSFRITPRSSISWQPAGVFDSFAMGLGRFGWRTSTTNPTAVSNRPSWLPVDGRMGKVSLVIGLVEDKRQQQFIYRFLKKIGYPEHEIRFRPVPGGMAAAHIGCSLSMPGR